MLGDLMDFRSPHAVGQVLHYIRQYCLANDLPPLTILVVGKGTGEPGMGMGEFKYADQEAVFEFDWYSLMPPTPKEFETEYQQEK